MHTELRAGGMAHDDANRQVATTDSGFSLVEIVMTIVLVGTVVLAIMNASIAGIRSSSVSAYAGQVETVLQNAADRVNRATKRCEYSEFVRAAASAQWGPEHADLASATYQYYEPNSAGVAVAGAWVGGPSKACAGDLPNTEVQLVSIKVTSPDGKVTRQVKVVKND